MEKRSGGTSRLARRRFLKAVPAAVAAGLAAPALARQAQEQRISKDALDCAEKIIGVDFTDADQQQALGGVNNNLANFERLRKIDIPLDTEPAITFRPYLPGKKPKPGATPNGEGEGHACSRPGGAAVVARRPRVSAGHRAGGARPQARRLVDRADADVSRAAQEVRAEAELRRHADRGARAGAGGAGRQGDPRRPLQGAAARHPLGREGSLRDQGHPHHLGRRGRIRTRSSTTTRPSSSGCATPARCSSPSCRSARWRRATTGSAARRRTRGTARGSSGSSAGPGVGDGRRPGRLRASAPRRAARSSRRRR